jgi:uncharacterized protein
VTVSSQTDFDYSILDVTSHRPWPLPDGPWIMTQSWHDLLFAHWPVDQDRLRAVLPAGLTLDLFEGQAWLGIVPFHMTNVAPRGVPALPWVSAFPELNVRTYATMHGRPGVYFFSLDAGNPIAVGAARALFSLPYFSATMKVKVNGDWTAYESQRSSGDAAFAGRYRPVGPVSYALPGTLDHFLTERYCLYTVDRNFHAWTVDIHHPPWPLQPAELLLSKNTMADAAGIPLPPIAPLLHFSRRQDVVAWPIRRVDRT